MNEIAKQIPNNIAVDLKLASVGEGLFQKSITHEFETQDYSVEINITVSGSTNEYIPQTHDSPEEGGGYEVEHIEFDGILIFDSEGDEVSLSAEDLYAVQMEIENSIVFE